MTATTRWWGALVVVALSSCGQSVAELTDARMSSGEAFVQVSRGELTANKPVDGYVPNGENFYVAINKAELGQKWFLSAYLTQWHPSWETPMQSLGTRVVSFKVQNGKLFVFDVTDGKTWSDLLDPQVVVEAYPIVTDNAAFNALQFSGNYVLFDPSAGLNRFSFVSDTYAQGYGTRFQVDITYLQKFKELSDGVSFEQVFTGYSETGGEASAEQPFRASGTLATTLRRYSEGQGFTRQEWKAADHTNYFSGMQWQLPKNEPRISWNLAKWNIKPGMQPIQWRIGREVAGVQADPRLAGIDVRGAIKKGIEGWNQAFGFTVFQVVDTAATDSPGDDDKNFVVVDQNPGAGLAFANWRENPNTGEIRGASVYFSSVFIDGALQKANSIGLDAGTVTPPADAGTALVDAGTAVQCSPGVVMSQVFGGNSATGAFNQDFVELHNRTAQPVSLSGWSLQYSSASGTSWAVAPLSGTIAPNGYFLVGLSAASGGTRLPTVDATASLSLAAAAGKVALVASTIPLSGACPATFVDFVGYGAANCAEGILPAPAASSTLSVRRRDACADTNVNTVDFEAVAPSPKNSASAALACSCTAGAPVAGVSSGGSTGLVAPQPKASTPRLSWDAMPQRDTCSLELRGEVKALPPGITQKELVEKTITEAILHEIGHTLGLRHNFKGSLTQSSVMDYLDYDDAALVTGPLPYDVAAVRYLYGLDAAKPSQPFCTDEDTLVDAQCDRFDKTANPLTNDLAPYFSGKLRGVLAGTDSVTYGQLHLVTRYVRAPASEAQRLEAFNLMMNDLSSPLRADIIALSPDAAVTADSLAAAIMANLFVDELAWRDEIGVTPSMVDVTFSNRVTQVAQSILLDDTRGLQSRWTMIDALKGMRSYAALQSLTAARNTLATRRSSYDAASLPAIDELIRRIDLATNPYF